MFKSRLTSIGTALFISTLLVSGALAMAGQARSSVNQWLISPTTGPDPSSPAIQQEGPWVVRAYFTEPEAVAEVAARLEPWEVNYDQGYMVLEVDQDEYQRLERSGLRLEINPKLSAQLRQPRKALPGQTTGIPGYPCYRTVEETFQSAQSLAQEYPLLSTWIDMGDSWDKTQPEGAGGYDLGVLRLTSAHNPGPKPKLFVMSAMHAREYAPAELNTRFAERLIAGYGVDPDVTWLLDYREVHLLLHANPDGRKYAETGLFWRKNTNQNYCSPTSNARGADLNRNFSFQWGCCGGSSADPCDETYRGPGQASEPETQAIQDYLRAQFPDQRDSALEATAPITTSGVFIDLHSYGQLVLWPWGFSQVEPPNGPALQTLGRKLAFYNQYQPQQAIDLYPADGASDDFAYGDLGLAAYTLELGTAFFQSCTSFESSILTENLQALIYAAKIARRPYLTPSGPEVLDPSVSQTTVVAGESVQLSARLDDTRYSRSNGIEPSQIILAAEYSLNTPPFESQSPSPTFPMFPADEAFDSSIETVTATLDTTNLSPGRHTLYVHGQDADGNWGPASAVFLYVIDPETAPLVEGYLRSGGTNYPLSGSLTAGPFQTSSDPDTGFYSLKVISGTYNLLAQAPQHAPATINGIQARGGENVHLDVSLDPMCDVFSDTVESGQDGWTADPPWEISNESYHSPQHAWSDSPDSNYGNSQDVSLTSPILDLSDRADTRLTFWHTYDLEENYDFAYVDYSTDGGSTWVNAATYNGQGHTLWTQEEISLPDLDGQSQAQIRFRLITDKWITADGWHIDDIKLATTGQACVPQIPPHAEFTTSPGIPDRPVQFTNLSYGTFPLNYRWNFGDELGTSTLSDPSYTYSTTGTFTVSLGVTNSLGSDSFSQQVLIQSCQPLTGLDLTIAPPGTLHTNEIITFKADFMPNEATTPITYSLDFMDGSPPVINSTLIKPAEFDHSYAVTGTYPVEMTAWNCPGAPSVSDTVTLAIAARHGLSLTPGVAQRAAPPGTAITYTLRITNLGEVADTFDLFLEGGAWKSDLSTSTIGPLLPSEGEEFTLQVTIPSSIPIGTQDQVTVRGVSQYSDTPTASAAMSTLADWWRLFLVLIMQK